MRAWTDRALVAAMLTMAGCPALADCPPAVAARGPQEVAARIDTYDSRSPQTYRALAGLGDPPVEANEATWSVWQLDGPGRALVARMMPGSAADRWHVSLCRTDHALRLARARIAALGENHPYVEQWMRAQRAVFSACARTGAGRAAALPPPLPVSDPALARLQRDDRGYQIASMIFYRDPAGARPAFRAIAGSPSRHAAIARYMVAAIDARELGDYVPEEDMAAVHASRGARVRTALAEAQAILADPRLAAVHPLAQGLIGYLGYWTGDARVRTAQVRSTLAALAVPEAKIVANRSARDRYARALNDIRFLRQSFADEIRWRTGARTGEPTAVRAMAAEARRNPFAAWLISPPSPFEREPWIRAGNLHRGAWASFRRTAERQAARERGQAWAALLATWSTRYEPAGWRRLERLEREMAACPSDDRLAAFTLFSYHQVRTAIMYPALDGQRNPRPDQDGFRRALDHLAARPWRDRLQFQMLFADALQYLVSAGRLDEARRLRDRVERRETWYEEMVPLLLLAEDEDALVRQLGTVAGDGETLLNLLSIEALSRLAARPDVPQPRRALLARVAWTRLYALGRRIPRPLDRLMRALNPEITAGWGSRPGAAPGSRSLLLDVLRSPGLNILITNHNRMPGNESLHGHSGLTEIDVYEHSDNNWWCAWEPERHTRAANHAMYYAFFAPWDYRGDPPAEARAPAMLRPVLRSSWLWNNRDRAEQAALARIACAPRLLSQRAIAWRGPNLLARLRGRAGQDEALALAVRATRYGCQRQGGHGHSSSAAFALLHRRFAQSAAARRTRYWFDCAHFSGGCDGHARRAAERRAWR